MIQIENDCRDCGLPCQFTNCEYYRVAHYYCDNCKEEDELYEYEGSQLCEDCLLKTVPKVE